MKKIILITVIFNILIISLVLLLSFGFRFNSNISYVGLKENQTTTTDNTKYQEYTTLKYGCLDDKVEIDGDLNKIGDEILTVPKTNNLTIGDKYYIDDQTNAVGYVSGYDESYYYIDQFSNYEVSFIYMPDDLYSLKNIDKIINTKYLSFDCSNTSLKVEKFKLDYVFDEDNDYYLFNLSELEFTGIPYYDYLDITFTFENNVASLYIDSEYIHYANDKFYLVTIDNKYIDIEVIKEVGDYVLIESNYHNLNTKFIKVDEDV